MKKVIMYIAGQMAAMGMFAQAWTALADQPVALAFPVVVVLNDNIHVIGGGGPGGATGLHLRYQTASDTWDTLADVPYLAQQPAGAALNGKIYYFGGGYPNSGTPLDENYEYDPVTDSWNQVSSIPAVRVIHKTAVINDSIYVLGGQPDKLRFELYSVNEDSWKSLNNLPDQHFWYGVIVSHNDTMYRFGGGGALGPVKTAQRYNLAADQWTAIPDLPDVEHGMAGAVIGDSVYLAGGYGTNDIHGDMWIYNIRTQTYQKSYSMPEARAYHEMVSIGSCVYSVGGHHPLFSDLGVSLIRHCVGDTAISGINLHNDRSIPFVISPGIDDLLISTDYRLAHRSVMFELLDISGKQVISQLLTLDDAGSGRIAMPSMSGSGVYIGRIIAGDVVATKKILIP